MPGRSRRARQEIALHRDPELEALRTEGYHTMPLPPYVLAGRIIG